MEPTPTNARRLFVVSTIVTIAVFVVSIVLFGFLFVSASTEARASVGDAVFPKELLGLPVMEGFKNAGRFGVHLFPGALLFLVVPAVIGIGCALPGVLRFVKARA
ncbi:MAG TPA: transcriptional regulator [Terrimesophilobacter sp.]|nr:transcriptional regulator [Terrimesophilobacter sp.]